MAWTITYRMVREQPLTETERLEVVRHVVRHNRQRWADGSFPLYLADAPREDHQVAWARTQWESEDALDLPRFITAVTELRSLIEDWRFILTDSEGRLGWRGGKRQRYLIGDKHVETTELPDPDISQGWVSALALGIPEQLEISPPVRSAMASIIARMSPPRQGMRSPHVLREVLDSVEQLAGQEDAGREQALPLLTLGEVYRSILGPQAVRAGLARWERLPPSVRAIVVEGAQQEPTVRDALEAAAADHPEDNTLARLVNRLA